MVPKVGIEPTRAQGPGDIESSVSNPIFSDFQPWRTSIHGFSYPSAVLLGTVLATQIPAPVALLMRWGREGYPHGQEDRDQGVRGRRGHHGERPPGGPRPEPGAPGLDQGRPPGEHPGFYVEQGLRLGAEIRRPRRPGDRGGRSQHDHRRRQGFSGAGWRSGCKRKVL